MSTLLRFTLPSRTFSGDGLHIPALGTSRDPTTLPLLWSVASFPVKLSPLPRASARQWIGAVTVVYPRRRTEKRLSPRIKKPFDVNSAFKSICCAPYLCE